MTASIPITRAHVVAALVQPTSKAAFSRGQLIVTDGDGLFVRAQTYDHEAHVQGPALTAEDVHGLIETTHAIALPGSHPLAAGATLWMLRRGLPRRDAALKDINVAGILIHPMQPGPDGSWLCVIDERRPEAAALRDRWRDEATQAAKVHAREGRWLAAENDAEVAYTFARSLDPDTLALLSLTHEKTGRDQRASGLFDMALRSRGEAFVEQMRQSLDELKFNLIKSPIYPSVTHAGLRKTLEGMVALMVFLNRPKHARLS